MDRDALTGWIDPAAASGHSWLRALRRYLTVLALGNLTWELLHMPFYGLWSTGTWGEILFAALHCTGGDLLIGLSALMIGLVAAANPDWPRQRFWWVAAITVMGGVLYTGFSEWLNVEVRRAWSYSDLMPTVVIGGFGSGLSPVLQWLVVPTVAFGVNIAGTRSMGRERATPGERPTRDGLDMAQLPSERPW